MEEAIHIKLSTIRTYLLRYAEKRKILIKEYVSDNEWEPIAYFCHWQSYSCDPLKTSTAVSNNSHDDALVMAALSFLDPTCNFIPEDA